MYFACTSWLTWCLVWASTIHPHVLSCIHFDYVSSSNSRHLLVRNKSIYPFVTTKSHCMCILPSNTLYILFLWCYTGWKGYWLWRSLPCMSNLQRREDESSKDVVSLVLHAPELLPRASMQPASEGVKPGWTSNRCSGMFTDLHATQVFRSLHQVWCGPLMWACVPLTYHMCD